MADNCSTVTLVLIIGALVSVCAAIPLSQCEDFKKCDDVFSKDTDSTLTNSECSAYKDYLPCIKGAAKTCQVETGEAFTKILSVSKDKCKNKCPQDRCDYLDAAGFGGDFGGDLNRHGGQEDPTGTSNGDTPAGTKRTEGTGNLAGTGSGSKEDKEDLGADNAASSNGIMPTGTPEVEPEPTNATGTTSQDDSSADGTAPAFSLLLYSIGAFTCMNVIQFSFLSY